MRSKLLSMGAGFASFVFLFLPGALMGAPKSTPVEEPDEPPAYSKPLKVTYPYEMRVAGLNGRVLLEFIVTPDGRASQIEVVNSNNPWFERPAIDALLASRFAPGKKAGKPVHARAQQEIAFRLNGPAATWWSIEKKDQSTLPPQFQWDIAPEPVNTDFPVFPRDALLAGKNGDSMAKIFIGADGDVLQVSVSASAPEFGWATLAAMERWKFAPARKADGTPSMAIVNVRQEFRHDGSGEVPIMESTRALLERLRKKPQSIVAVADLDAPLQRIVRREASYPLLHRKERPSGEARVEFYIDEKGDVHLPRLISATTPAFGSAAVHSVVGWRYEPPKHRGRPAVVRCEEHIEFVAPKELEAAGL